MALGVGTRAKMISSLRFALKTTHLALLPFERFAKFGENGTIASRTYRHTKTVTTTHSPTPTHILTYTKERKKNLRFAPINKSILLSNDERNENRACGFNLQVRQAQQQAVENYDNQNGNLDGMRAYSKLKFAVLPEH